MVSSSSGLFSTFAWEPKAGMQEDRHVIQAGAVFGSRSRAKKSWEARLRTAVIVLQMST